ncbi:hypothetical protein SAY87_029173 [Trapa incisa]|uniref:Uncharacterized protein n=1 Tax=Trapa incisa TaxID=236973 RepID=A0AAN7QPH4_9MYRT|nr:hypothetical protein SAY87_029173 [Trapa incisa]
MVYVDFLPGTYEFDHIPSGIPAPISFHASCKIGNTVKEHMMQKNQPNPSFALPLVVEMSKELILPKGLPSD